MNSFSLHLIMKWHFKRFTIDLKKNSHKKKEFYEPWRAALLLFLSRSLNSTRLFTIVVTFINLSIRAIHIYHTHIKLVAQAAIHARLCVWMERASDDEREIAQAKRQYTNKIFISLFLTVRNLWFPVRYFDCSACAQRERAAVCSST